MTSTCPVPEFTGSTAVFDVVKFGAANARVATHAPVSDGPVVDTVEVWPPNTGCSSKEHYDEHDHSKGCLFTDVDRPEAVVHGETFYRVRARNRTPHPRGTHRTAKTLYSHPH